MSTDNPGNFFGDMSFQEDGNEDSWKPVNIHGKALFKKSIDILNLSQIICDLLEAEEGGEETGRLIIENAMVVSAKIRGAIGADHIYSLAMENAVIIKVNICELKAQLWACEKIHAIDEKYIAVLKVEIETFKQLFIEWVSCFDKKNMACIPWFLQKS
jgi:hypothetical protein